MTAVSAERGDLALLIVIAPVVHPLGDAPPEKPLGQKNKRVTLTTRGQRIKRATLTTRGQRIKLVILNNPWAKN